MTKIIDYGKIVFIRDVKVLPMGLGWRSATVGMNQVTRLYRRIDEGEDVLTVDVDRTPYTLEVEWREVSSSLRREVFDVVCPAPPKRVLPADPKPAAALAPKPVATPVPKKKGGRPKGSKNKPKNKPKPKAVVETPSEVPDAAQ